MKGLKKYFGIIISIIMVLAVVPAFPSYASGRVVVAVSSSSLNIGDTVTITATAQGPSGEQTTATLGFNYDSSKLSFVSCSESTYSGGGGGYVGVVAEKASITLKAESAGSASISVSGDDGVIFSSGEEIGSLSAGGTTITVNNAAATTTTNNNGEGNTTNQNLSGDNSLSSLTISPGTLSPAFKYSTTNYTASVGSDVNEIAVDAKVSNSKATVESVTGNTNLKEGNNTISIVVKAENGTTATYKIVVTKGGASQPTQEEPTEETPTENDNVDSIMLNGHEYNLAATIPDDNIPEEFSKITVNCKGQDVEALQFDKGNVVLVYLTTPDTEVKNTLAVYDQESGSIYPFVKVVMGSSYYIILNPPAETGLSEEYTAATVDIGEYGALAAYSNQEPSLSDFYLVYAISNGGNTGWYQYDKSEGTLQRYIQQSSETTVDEEALNADMRSLQNAYDKLDKQYTSEKSFARKTIAVLVFVIAVLLVIIVNLFLRRRNEEDEWEDDFNEVPKRFRKKPEERKETSDDWEDEELDEKPRRGILRKKQQEDQVLEEKPKRGAFGKKQQEEESSETKVPEKKEPGKKTPEKKEPEKKEPEEPDDFEVIDLDDL